MSYYSNKDSVSITDNSPFLNKELKLEDERKVMFYLDTWVRNFNFYVEFDFLLIS